MAKRILVLSAAVGAGHMRAAQAVELALKELDPKAEIRNVDVLTLTNAAFRRVYSKTYMDLAHSAPHLVGYLYELFDKPSKKEHPFGERMKKLVQEVNFSKLIALMQENWDLLVNTHFLPAEICSDLRKKGKLSTPQFIVTTDFETHRMWVHTPCEQYFTATEEGAAYLASMGVPKGIINTTGIPIHPLFSRPKDRAECLKRQGLVGDRALVVQMAGGFGVGPIRQIYEGLLECATPLELVVVAGKNEKAKKDLEKVKVPARHRAKVLGFTDQMDELMQVADLVVSKPGGLTTSELLARGAAMAIVNPIPGQESRNSDFLLENGAAIKINSLATLSYKVGALLADPVRLAQMKANAKRLGRPQAAFDVAAKALAWES